MNIKDFFHETLNYYDDNDKLVSEYSFAKDTLHKEFESFEEVFDAAIAKNSFYLTRVSPCCRRYRKTKPRTLSTSQQDCADNTHRQPERQETFPDGYRL